MRKSLQHIQIPAAEVHNIDTDFIRSAGQRMGHHDSLQQRCLTGNRCAINHKMACLRRIKYQRILFLVGRIVHQTDGNLCVVPPGPHSSVEMCIQHLMDAKLFRKFLRPYLLCRRNMITDAVIGNVICDHIDFDLRIVGFQFLLALLTGFLRAVQRNRADG